MEGRSINYTQTSKVQSLHEWTGHQSKFAFIWKNLGWEVLVLWCLCGTSGSPHVPHYSWGSLPIPGVAHLKQGPPQLLLQMHRAWSEQVWAATALEALPRWKGWLSSAFTKSCLASVRSDRCKHLLAPQNAASLLGLSLESRFAGELSTSGCWERGWGWMGQDVSNTGVKNGIFDSFSEGLSDRPSSEMHPHMQMLCFFCCCIVFSEDSRAACTRKCHWLLSPLWWEKSCESRTNICFPVKRNTVLFG